jgi:hypothetical protein
VLHDGAVYCKSNVDICMTSVGNTDLLKKVDENFDLNFSDEGIPSRRINSHFCE